MKLLGKDFDGAALLRQVEDRLRARGLWPESQAGGESDEPGVEPRVEPLTFHLQALEEHADPTRPMPLHTHRGGAGRLVLLAKWAFRRSCQVFINETLARQRVFNQHLTQAYAELSADVLRLERRLEEQSAALPAAAPKPASKRPRGTGRPRVKPAPRKRPSRK